MQQSEIAAAVRDLSGLSSKEHAEAATRATLRVLGQRLAGGEPGDLAAQLPKGIAEALPSTGERQTFGIEEFYRRIADEEGMGCTFDGAREHARAVMVTLKSGVDRGEWGDLVSQLPASYEDVLATEPSREQR